MFNLQEILKFRDSVQFRAVTSHIADRIANIPWEVTPADDAVRQAIACPNPNMSFSSFIRRSILDMLALNFGTFEVAVTEQDKFILMQCFPAELFAVKEWTKDSPKDQFRWIYHDQHRNTDIYLSDQKIAIFPSYGNFDITYEEMWGLPSPTNQIMEAITLKLEEKSPSLPRMDSLHIFDASLTLQNALEKIPEPEPGYASIWQNQYGNERAITKLKSGIILPNEPAIVLGKGNGIELQGYSNWISKNILIVLLHIYRSLLKGTEQEQVVREAIGVCGGYEDMIVAIALIISQGINRLMKNIGIDCEFRYLEVPLSQKEESALRERQNIGETLESLGYPPELAH